jgi:hypothetical protein
MSASFVWSGLDQLMVDLHDLPAALVRDGNAIVDNSANSTADEIRGAYPPGELADGVKVETMTGSAFFVGRRVRSTSPLAFIYESGTQVRHTSLGYNRGRMLPAHVYVPRMIHARQALDDEWRGLLRRHGLTVTG